MVVSTRSKLLWSYIFTELPLTQCFRRTDSSKACTSECTSIGESAALAGNRRERPRNRRICIESNCSKA